MVVRRGFEPPVFTSWVTGLQPAAFSLFAYLTSCASALCSGGWIRTGNYRINSAVLYH